MYRHLMIILNAYILAINVLKIYTNFNTVINHHPIYRANRGENVCTVYRIRHLAQTTHKLKSEDKGKVLTR